MNDIIVAFSLECNIITGNNPFYIVVMVGMKCLVTSDITVLLSFSCLFILSLVNNWIISLGEESAGASLFP